MGKRLKQALRETWFSKKHSRAGGVRILLAVILTIQCFCHAKDNACVNKDWSLKKWYSRNEKWQSPQIKVKEEATGYENEISKTDDIMIKWYNINLSNISKIWDPFSSRG